MYGKVVLIIVLSAIHIFFGVISCIVGILSSAQSLIWMAHTVSPLWSGAFFTICGCTGLAMFKHRSQYSILCFAALNSITLIIGVVNMQLLRVGLVNFTTLGKSFQKENKDINIIIAMCVDGCESLVCIISILISFKLNHDAKNNRFKSDKKEGAFFVQIISDKDIVVVQSKQTSNGTGCNGSSSGTSSSNGHKHANASRLVNNSSISTQGGVNQHGHYHHSQRSSFRTSTASAFESLSGTHGQQAPKSTVVYNQNSFLAGEASPAHFKSLISNRAEAV